MTTSTQNAKGLSGSAHRLLRKVPQFTRLRRHAWSLVKHSNVKRIANLVRVELEYRLHKTRIKGRPYILIVDPTTICNLKCPLCPTGTKTLNRKPQMMAWDTYTRTLDLLAPHAYEINLHNWGESLLHPRIFDMIHYARRKNLATNMSTNFNRVQPEDIDQIVASGLEYLILSIDGVSPETYRRYRRGGDLEQVLENVRRLVATKASKKSQTPYIEWQFIVFRHNQHEIEAARRMASDLGVDRFRLIPPGLPFEDQNAENLKKKWFIPSLSEATGGEIEDLRADQISSGCFYLYRSVTVNPDGRIAPCCIVYGAQNDFGDLTKSSFTSIWNNPLYTSARAQFKTNGKVTVPTVCDRCSWFKKKTNASI